MQSLRRSIGDSGHVLWRGKEIKLNEWTCEYARARSAPTCPPTSSCRLSTTPIPPNLSAMSPIIDKIKSILHPSHESTPAQSTPATSSSSTPAVADTPAFDKDKVVVLFVLGGPGVGASSYHLLGCFKAFYLLGARRLWRRESRERGGSELRKRGSCVFWT